MSPKKENIPRIGKGRSCIYALVVLVILGLVLVLAAELAGRLLPSFTSYRYRFTYEKVFAPSPYVGVVPRPGLDLTISGAHFKINSLGFRGEETAIAKKQGTFRIICLGGSTTFGMYHLKDEAETYPGQLEKILQDQGLKVEVLNGGVPGYSTRTTLINLVSRIRYLDPDLVLVMHNTNDLALNGSGQLREKQALPVYEGRTSTFLPWWLIMHSYAAAELEYRLGMIKLPSFSSPAPKATPEAGSQGNGHTPGKYSQADAGVFEENLNLLADLAQKFGFRLGLVTMAQAIGLKTDLNNLTEDEKKMNLDGLDQVYLRLDPDQVGPGLENYNEIIRKVARERNLILSDSAPEVPRTPEYFYDRVHLRPPGYAIVAAKAAKAMVDAGIFENRKEN